MKILCAIALAVLMTGCGEGRYQIAAMESGAGVWRLDTKTGELAICGASLPPNDGTIKCITSLR